MIKQTGKEISLKNWWGVSLIAIFCMIVLFPSFALSADQIPEKVTFLIEKKAIAQFPYDRNSQTRVIESQKSAYITVKNYTNEKVPGNIITRIKERAAFECPTNYCAQKYLVETQVRDCCYLRTYSHEEVPNRILKRMLLDAETEFPNDYSTQKMVVEAKVKEYLSYDRVTRLEYCERVLDAALDEMEESLLSLQKNYVVMAQRFDETQKEEIQITSIQQREAQEEKVRKAAIHRNEIRQEEIQRNFIKVFPTAAAVGRYHVVKKGENLYRISLRYGLPLNKLCKENGITPEHTIWPGQRILISL